MKNLILRALACLNATLLSLSISLISCQAFAQMAHEASMGEVRKIDKDSNKITLKHGDIKNLDMPPMTMVFKVKDPGALDKLKPGDKILFRAIKDSSGFVITEITLQ
jgi:Cu(I)/Ag(I) efflux system periplasmic protein CusF